MVRYTCKSSDILSTAQRNLLTQILLPEAARKLANAIKVIQPVGALYQLSFSLSVFIFILK